MIKRWQSIIFYVSTLLFVLFGNVCFGKQKPKNHKANLTHAKIKATKIQHKNLFHKNKKINKQNKQKRPHKYLKRQKPLDKNVSKKAVKSKTLFLAHNSAILSHHHASHDQKKDIRQEEDNDDDEEDEQSDKVAEDHAHYIRVLLEEHAPTETYYLSLKAQDGFVLESPAHSNITALYQSENLSLLVKGGNYYLQCQDGKYRRVKHNDVEICSPHNNFTLNGKVYQGSLYICQDKKTSSILLINKLELEDYLYSVLRHEGIPSWPLEMHKVQAVASRTYALYHMKQSRIKNPHSPYDIKNTSYFQIYNGSHKETFLRKAVESTRNMVLTYKGNIALTMFDICCGGIIPAQLRNRDTSKPYLCRKEPCHYCKNTSHYSWKESVSKSTMFDCLKKCPKCKDKFAYFGNTLVDMQVIDKDKAGVAHKVKCVGKRATVILTASEVKSALQGRLRSLAFSIKKDGHHFVFSGRGNSHFRGLCQWGAKGLVDRGWNYKEILQFYYPNTKLSYLK